MITRYTRHAEIR